MSEEATTLDKEEVVTAVIEETEESTEQIANEKVEVQEEAKTEIEKVVTENEDDEEVEWSQSAPKAETPNTLDDSPNAETTGLKERVKELEQENGLMKAELQNLATIKDDPIVKAYSAYLSSTDKPSVNGFLSQVGAISTSPADGLTGETLIKKQYEDIASKAGLTGEDLDDAVEEELDTYRNATRLKKVSLENDAKSHFKGSGSKTIEGLEEEFKANANKMDDNMKAWLNRQGTMAHDLVNKIVAKGKYNGRPVDSKWGEQMKMLMSKSNDMTNPAFVRYVASDEGYEDLYAPDVIEFLDFSANREAYKKTTKKQVDSAKVENLSEKAEVAHNDSIAAEKAMAKKNEGDLSWFIAHEADKGKRHPQDPRGKKA